MPATIDFIVDGQVLSLPIKWEDGKEARVEKVGVGATDVTVRPVVKNDRPATITLEGVSVTASGIVASASLVNTVPVDLAPGEEKTVPIKFVFQNVVPGAVGRAVLTPKAKVA